MDNNKLDFLGGETPAEITAPELTPEVPTPEAAPSGPERGPDGKFVSSAPPVEQEPIPAPAPIPEPPAKPEPGHVPLTAMLDERDKRQAAEKRLAEYERAQQKPAPTPPDPYEDPAAFADFQTQQTQQHALNIRLDLSEDLARSKHGEEPVNNARDWALAKMAQSPAFNHEVLSHRNPYEFIVQQHQRDQLVAQVQGSDFEEFKAWQAAKAGLTQSQPAATAAPPAPVAAPPRSLAAATSAGGLQAIPQGEGVAYDSLFKR